MPFFALAISQIAASHCLNRPKRLFGVGFERAQRLTKPLALRFGELWGSVEHVYRLCAAAQDYPAHRAPPVHR